jgi:hypothetical protein
MKTSIDRAYYGWLFVAGILTYVVHEAAHWLMGRTLGYPMAASLNSVRALTPTTLTDATLISAAGPAITIVQALIAFHLVRTRLSTTAFAFLIWAAFLRLVATGISLLMPNDEARISMALDLGTWTIPLLVSGGLAWLAWSGSRRFQLGWKVGLATYLITSLTAALVVGGDAMIKP